MIVYGVGDHNLMIINYLFHGIEYGIILILVVYLSVVLYNRYKKYMNISYEYEKL